MQDALTFVAAGPVFQNAMPEALSLDVQRLGDIKQGRLRRLEGEPIAAAGTAPGFEQTRVR